MIRPASLVALSLMLLLSACGKEPLYQEQGYVFGTLVEVSIYGEQEAQAKQAVAEVMREFQRLHDKLHAWQPSELSELNAALAKGKSRVVSLELAAMLHDAAQLSQQSRGLFNPVIGSLIQLWGFHADEFKAVQPDEKLIAKLLKENPQMSDLVFSAASGTGELIRSRNRAVQMDLGGYAKGYALERAVELLRKQGIRNALVNIGGNVIALGSHGKRPWRVGIQHPRKAGALATLDLRDGEAIGTSGDYQRYFIAGDKRYCHLIDPRSGYPMQGVQAVTIITRGPHAGVLSDVASKPLFIAGAPGWKEAAAQMGIAEALLVDGQDKIHITSALAQRIEFTDKDMRAAIEP